MRRLLLEPKSKSYLWWEHLLKSAVAFVGSYVALFWAPFFLGGKSRRNNFRDDDYRLNLVAYVVEHPIQIILICCLVVFILNIYLTMKNRKIIYMHSYQIVKDELVLKLIDLRLKRSKTIVFPIAILDLKLLNKKIDGKLDSQDLKLIDRKSSKVIGKLKPSHFFWEPKKKEIFHFLKDLKEFNIELISKTDERNSIATTMFKTRW